MPPVNQELVDNFTAKATIVNAVVQEAPNIKAALQNIIDICEKKAPCEMMDDEPGTEKGPLGPNKVPTRLEKIIAAPALPEDQFNELEAMCKEKGFKLLRSGLRKYLAGIDMGVSPAILGVAASGTCMVDTDKEEDRLSGMISEINVLLLKKSEIYPDLDSIVDKVRERVNAQTGTFTTFVTGPSRTADIERVAAVGVHGPLEQYIILLED